MSTSYKLNCIDMITHCLKRTLWSEALSHVFTKISCLVLTIEVYQRCKALDILLQSIQLCDYCMSVVSCIHVSARNLSELS